MAYIKILYDLIKPVVLFILAWQLVVIAILSFAYAICKHC